MTTISFIGLGVMGRPMAVNLQRAGFDVTSVSRSERSRTAGRDAGLLVVDDATQLPAADVVITMLPDSPDVSSVLLPLFETATPGTLFLDMSTISPVAARTLAEAAREAGHRFVDAPVSGGEAGAIEGNLSIMIGGEESDVAAARPVFDAVGATIVHVGPSGAGQVVKAANQLIVAGNIQMLAEAVVFLEAHGVELDAALDVIGGGLAGSTVLQRKRAAMTSREFAPGFRLTLHNKDLGIVASAAREAGISLPAAALVSQLVLSAVARGDGDLDHSALLKLAEEASGRGES